MTLLQISDSRVEPLRSHEIKNVNRATFCAEWCFSQKVPNNGIGIPFILYHVECNPSSKIDVHLFKILRIYSVYAAQLGLKRSLRQQREWWKDALSLKEQQQSFQIQKTLNIIMGNRYLPAKFNSSVSSSSWRTSLAFLRRRHNEAPFTIPRHSCLVSSHPSKVLWGSLRRTSKNAATDLWQPHQRRSA